MSLLGNKIQYDKDALELEYLVATRETAFETKFLARFDVELLIGQVTKVHVNNYVYTCIFTLYM